MINGQFFAILILLFALNMPIYAQTANEKLAKRYACSKDDIPQVVDYFDNLAEQMDVVAQCELETKGQIKLAGGCEWTSNGCPVNLVKPFYPQVARNLKLFGLVEVAVIIDEKGNVIYSQVLQGSPFFSVAAQKASCQSQFRPTQMCGRVTKATKVIGYNFIKP